MSVIVIANPDLPPFALQVSAVDGNLAQLALAQMLQPTLGGGCHNCAALLLHADQEVDY